MGKKYDVHDSDGHKIGSIEQVPSDSDTIIGGAILLHLLTPALPVDSHKVVSPGL